MTKMPDGFQLAADQCVYKAKGSLQKKKPSYLVTLSIIAFTPTLPRPIVTKCHSDKVVPPKPPPSLEK